MAQVRATAGASDAADLARIVDRLRWRLGLEQVLVLVLRASCAALGAFSALFLAAWLVQLDLPLPLLAGLFAAPVLVALGVALVRWPTPNGAARVADRRMGLQARLATAVELASAPGTRVASSRFALLQQQDAVSRAVDARAAWPSPLVRARAELLAAVGLGLLSAALVVLLTRVADPSAGRPGTALITRLMDLAAPAEADAPAPQPPPLTRVEPTPPSGSGQGAARESGTGAAQLGGSDGEAGRGEASAAAQAQPSTTTRQALDRLAQALSQGSATRGAAERIEQGDYAGAAADLARLADEVDQLSRAAKDQLAGALRDAARDTAPSSRALAEREQRAAEALAGSSYDAQRLALRDLGREVERAASGSTRQAQGQADPRQAASAGGGPRGSGPAARQPGARPGPQGAGSAGGGAGSGAGTGQGASGEWSGDLGTPGERPSLAPGGAERERPFSPGDQATQLEAAGERVEVPAQVQRGGLTGRAATEPDPSAEPSGGESNSAARDRPRPQDPGTLAPEQNAIPSTRRQTVRDYFNGVGSR